MNSVLKPMKCWGLGGLFFLEDVVVERCWKMQLLGGKWEPFRIYASFTHFLEHDVRF